jgi:nucleotidyltransferase/DNA polymerase involved in DNA repair
MTRLVLVRCHELEEEDESGERLRRFGRVVEALSAVCPWIDAVRPGVCTLPVRGPARYFGDERAVLDRVTEVVEGALGAATPLELGVAEGVFAADLAARVGAVVAAGETARFLARWPIDVLGDADLTDLLVRLGLPTLGHFAALPTADVLARFGAAGARCHRIARAIDGELPGYRVPGMAARLVTALGRDLALTEHQPGFWGGASAADERAAEVLTDLQRRLGPEAVTVAVLGGGRGPGDRSRLVPWRPTAPPPDAGEDLPWPGRLPAPAPARVLDAVTVAEVVDHDGAPVGVTGRGLLTGQPARVSIDGGRWTLLAGWSAPWPVEERWWSRSRHRAARLQVVTTDGRGYLLLIERGRWRLEAAY